MVIREIHESEIQKLFPHVAALSEYHNQVSTNFKGAYPSRPYESTLETFEKNVACGESKIAVLDLSGEIAGFCKVDLHGDKGKLDYLVVMEEYRKNGYGGMLMDWAMKQFRDNQVSQIEVKVVDGNEAVHFYERYGFKMNAHLLWNCL